MCLAALGLVALLSAPADEAALLHALNRMTWGPTQSDLDRVRRLGFGGWLDEQLHPERLPDAKLEARLASVRTSGLDTAALRKGYEVPNDVKKELKARQASLGDDASEADVRALKRDMFVKLAPRMEGRPQQVIDDLQEARLLRAIYTRRQLEDVVTDFWMNHFNVYAAKGPDRYLLAEYERETIRPHVFGRFEDLLRATARSPAMLFYLDNWISAAPGTDRAVLRRALDRRPGPRGLARTALARPATPAEDGEPRRLGLNENYARELMELHTLGVDGGYSQQDVTEVARCFTGWTIRGLREDGVAPSFVFVPFLHAAGPKTVLGQRIDSGGVAEGEAVIRLLARHPATARFIATKLARRFVSDDPPQSLVDRLAATFARTGGDLREVVRALALSPELHEAGARGAKTKTPLEFVASALRATGADVLDARETARRLEAMGMPLYMAQPPTGYKDTADAWVSTGGLLARLNFALDLAAGRLPGVVVESSPWTAAGAGDTVQAIASRLLPTGLSDATLATLAAEGAREPARLAGLILGSPDFQRR